MCDSNRSCPVASIAIRAAFLKIASLASKNSTNDCQHHKARRYESINPMFNIRASLSVIRFIKAVTITLGLFVAVYVPAFAVTALLRPRIEVAIPLVIFISAGIAFALILLFSKLSDDVGEFGLSVPCSKYVWLALAFGTPLGLITGWVTQLFPSVPPYDVSRFTVLMIVSYFVIGASIQEEIIFRGLLQTMFQRIFNGSLIVIKLLVGYSVIAVALLFGLIHLPEGLAVAFCALVLALIAGELRKRSASIVPAIIVHMLFNAGSAAFAFPLRH